MEKNRFTVQKGGIFHCSINLLLNGPLFLLQSNGAAGISPTGHWIRGRYYFIHRDDDCVWLRVSVILLMQKFSHFSFKIVTTSITLTFLLCWWVTRGDIEVFKTSQHSILHPATLSSLGHPWGVPPSQESNYELTGPVVSHKSYLNNLFSFLFGVQKNEKEERQSLKVWALMQKLHIFICFKRVVCLRNPWKWNW